MNDEQELGDSDQGGARLTGSTVPRGCDREADAPGSEVWEACAVVKIDGMLGGSFDEIEDRARALEADGYDGGATAETSHDPFFPLLLAARATERLELSTGVAIAFARTPMTMASIANDLQLASKGRFSLGLGSQIKPHIERRFSMPWSHPAARMREFILAMRAIWAAWNGEEKLDFRGEFYTHTLMTPFFDPGPNPFGPPPVLLAAVGDLMTEVAGEVADGMILHPFTTERYVREVTLPGLGRGFEKGGRTPRRLHAQPPGVRRHRDHRRGVGDRAHRHQAADRVLRFDARLPRRAAACTAGRTSAPSSTSSRARVSGWRWASSSPTRCSRPSRWSRRPTRWPPRILARYGEVVDRLNFDAPYKSDPEIWTRRARSSSRPPVDRRRPTRRARAPTRRSTPRSRRATSTPWPRCGSTPIASS